MRARRTRVSFTTNSAPSGISCASSATVRVSQRAAVQDQEPRAVTALGGLRRNQRLRQLVVEVRGFHARKQADLSTESQLSDRLC